MKFKIEKAKFLEGLASISKILAESDKGELTLIAEAVKSSSVESSASFSNGLIVRNHMGDKMVCPYCGGEVDILCGGPDFEEDYVCRRCNTYIENEIFDCKLYEVSERAVADFVGNAIGKHYAQPCGDMTYRIGTIFGKDAFFSVRPKEGFFNSHNEDTVVILCDNSTVPRGWVNDTCKAVMFAELFYAKPGCKDIRIAEDVMAKLKPKVERHRFGKNRIIHERRDLWLSVIMNMLAHPYCGTDFRNGRLTGAAALSWFKKVHHGFNMSARTLSRDMDELRSFKKGRDKYDKHEPVLRALLKLVADPSVTPKRRSEISTNISEQLLKTTAATKRNGGEMVELPQTGWAIGADGHSERVLATSGEAIYKQVEHAIDNVRSVGEHAA